MSCPYLRETTDRNRPRTMILFATAISRLLGRVRTSCEMFWKAENIYNTTVLLVEGSLLTAGPYRFIGSHEAKIAAILQKCKSCPYLSETTDRNRPRGCKLHASPARLNAPKWRRGCMPVRRGWMRRNGAYISSTRSRTTAILIYRSTVPVVQLYYNCSCIGTAVHIQLYLDLVPTTSYIVVL